MPIENEEQFVQDLVNYIGYFDHVPEKIQEMAIEEIEKERKEIQKQFLELKEEYSELLGDAAKIRFKANSLYDQNRVIALTTGLLRQKLSSMKRAGEETPFDMDEAIEFARYFVNRYISKEPETEKEIPDPMIFED